MRLRSKRLATECGFELAGVARAGPLPEAAWYLEWVRRGHGRRDVLSHRPAVPRCGADPRSLLASARSIICVGKLYNTPEPYSTDFAETAAGRWISRYAWGRDYHGVVRAGLERLAAQARSPQRLSPSSGRSRVDTAPLLERAYARRAGLGWIGKNSCLINQRQGLLVLPGRVAGFAGHRTGCCRRPDRCGSCTRCIDACPDRRHRPDRVSRGTRHTVDSRRCISYLTIEQRGEIPEALRAARGATRIRVRHLPGRLPLEPPGAGDLRSGLRRQCISPALWSVWPGWARRSSGRVFRGSAVRRAGYEGLAAKPGCGAGNSGLE